MIYTAITGNKDYPREDVLCFGSYDKFKDPCLNAKIYKVLPHLFLNDEWTVWIDGNLHLKVEERELINLTDGHDIAVFTHPYRPDIYSEAKEIKRLGLDNKDIVNAQIKRYGDNVKGLGACYLIIRKNTPEINRLNEKWWAEICRGSRRDQISFPYVFGDVVKYIDYQDPFDNKYFTRKGHLK